MESTGSIVPYLWLLIPLFAILHFAYVAWNHRHSQTQQWALASLLLGIGGLLFWLLGPLAVYCSRRARRLGVAPGDPGSLMIRSGAILGYIGTILLGMGLLMFAIYFYAWVTGQYPFNR